MKMTSTEAVWKSGLPRDIPPFPNPFEPERKSFSPKLNKYGARISVIEIVFDEEKKTKKIEGILHIDRRAPIIATGEGDEFSEALSQLNDRLGASA